MCHFALNAFGLIITVACYGFNVRWVFPKLVSPFHIKLIKPKTQSFTKITDIILLQKYWYVLAEKKFQNRNAKYVFEVIRV